MPEQPVDRTVFAELLDNVGGDRAFLAELVDTYLTDSPTLFEELQAAVAAGDAVTARRAAHTLKSTSASFGATELASTCREIEMVAGAGDLAGVDGPMQRADRQYREVEAALRAAVAEGDAV